MGATVTTGKLATAFKAPNGEIIYALFEQTFEKNCLPHTPRWCCVSIGTLQTTIERIFSYGSSCEGGGLQGRSGFITPEGYIAGWLKELTSPVRLGDEAIKLTIGEGLYDVVKASNRDAICDASIASGRPDVADAIRSGISPTIHLHQDADLVLALLAAGVYPWRLLRNTDHSYTLRDPSLGYAPKPSRPTSIATPAFRKVDAENRLVQRDDGSWVCGGWEYSQVEGFIASLATVELREPGTYRARIKAFREAIQSAPPIPPGTMIVVDLSVPLPDRYHRDLVFGLRDQVNATATPTGYTFEVPADDTLRYRATNLPMACTTWVLPESAAATPAAGEQLSLIPA